MNTQFRKQQKIHGFTLFELLIVIAIITIIISVAAVSYSSVQKKSRDSKRRGDMKAIQAALEQYYGDNVKYPGSSYTTAVTTLSAAGYIQGSPPVDPKSPFGGTPTPYIQSSYSSTSYSICADLEGDGTFTGSGQDVCVTNLQ